MTRSLASDDFDTVLGRLPDFRAEVERQLAAAPDNAARETVLTEALALNRRWLSLAQSLESNMRRQLRSLEVESRYAGVADIRHVVETTG